MSIKNKTKEEVKKSFFYAKRKPFYPLALVVMLVILSLLIIPTPLTPVKGYTIIVDEAVDADSNIDAVANIGDDGATSYLDAQSQDDVDQVIVEGQGSGYVAGNNIEDFFDAVTDSQSPTDLGTYSSWTEMQDYDALNNTLTEENVAAAGVDESLYVDTNAASYSEWSSSGSSPYIDNTLDSTNYITALKALGVVEWFGFTNTAGTGSGFTVVLYVYIGYTIAGDGNDDVGWELDWTGDGTAEQTGTFTNPTNGWYNTGTVSGLDVDTEITDCRLSLNSIGSAKHNDLTVDAAYLKVDRAGSDNYRFDREFSFSSLDTDETNEYLCIFVETAGSETLDIDVWHSSAWTDIGTDIVDANDGVWVNISISTWLDASSEYFRFEDATTTSDTTQNTWEIAAVLIHSWSVGTDDYELEWEHQVNVDIDKDGWMLTIYGYYSDATEEIQIQMWDWVGSDWDTALATQITETEQWYNISISSSYVDTTNEWITYRFTDTDKTLSSDQDTLYLDYSGIRAWNMSTYWHSFVLSETDYNPLSNYVPFTDSPLSFQMEAGATYDVQIKGTDSILTAVASGYIYFNTVDDSGTATLLTTSYQNYLTSQSAGNNTHTIYLWINIGWSAGDPAVADNTYELVLNVYIVPA